MCDRKCLPFETHPVSQKQKYEPITRVVIIAESVAEDLSIATLQTHTIQTLLVFRSSTLSFSCLVKRKSHSDKF